MTLRLFVYGSLKRGFEAAPQMEPALFIGEAISLNSTYRLLAGKSGEDFYYPALCAGGQRKIKGELYEVSSSLLETLAEYEGEDYALMEIELQDLGLAYTYILKKGLDTQYTRKHPRIITSNNIVEWMLLHK